MAATTSNFYDRTHLSLLATSYQSDRSVSTETKTRDDQSSLKISDQILNCFLEQLKIN